MVESVENTEKFRKGNNKDSRSPIMQREGTWLLIHPSWFHAPTHIEEDWGHTIHIILQLALLFNKILWPGLQGTRSYMSLSLLLMFRTKFGASCSGFLELKLFMASFIGKISQTSKNLPSVNLWGILGPSLRNRTSDGIDKWIEDEWMDGSGNRHLPWQIATQGLF